MLDKIVRIAIENDKDILSRLANNSGDTKVLDYCVTFDDKLEVRYHYSGLSYSNTFSFADLWTSHGFMKAVCGEEIINVQLGDWRFVKEWPCHLFTISELSQIPTPEDRLKYIAERFLGGK